jgi:hypothetical protein
MKKYLKFIIPGVIVLAVVAWIYWPANNKKEETTQISTRKVEQINQLAIKDRPYVVLTPRTDGKEVTLIIDKVTNATSAEYELEYTAGSMIQGVFGELDFETDGLPLSKDLLFGSCSKGKCRYDENVSGGSLTIRFDGGDKPYTLKSDFNLQMMADREGVFTSKDIKASLDVGSSLSASTYLVVQNTMGLPEAVDGEVIAGPYAFIAANSTTLKGAELTIKSKDDLSSAKLMFWDGETWEELEAEVGEGQISAPVTSLGTFALVK